MANRKHIMFTSAWYPYKLDPMWGLFVKRHALAAAMYHQVSVLYVQGLVNQNQTYLIEQNNTELTTTYVYFKKSQSSIKLLAQLCNMLRYIIAFHKGYQHIIKSSGAPNLIHVNVLTRAAIYPWLLYKLKGIPYVVTEHWTRYLPSHFAFNGGVRKIITKAIVKDAACMLPVTQNLIEAMQQLGLHNNNYQLIHNVVDTDMFKPSTTCKSYFIHISCFDDQQKNISGLINAFKQAHDQQPYLQLVLVGDGPDMEKIKTQVQQLQLTSSITFTGMLENEALAYTLSQACCLLLFSRYENMPVVINEAFACGIPVITTDTGGVREHINSSNGIVLNTKQEEELTQSLLLFDATTYSKVEIRNYALKHFSVKAIALQLQDLYNAVLVSKS